MFDNGARPLVRNSVGRLCSYRQALTHLCRTRLPHVADVEAQREACRCGRAFFRSGWAAGAALAGFSANDLFAAPLDPAAPRGLLWEAGKARVVGVDETGLELSDGRRLARPGLAPVAQFTGASAWAAMQARIARKKAERRSGLQPARVGGGRGA